MTTILPLEQVEFVRRSADPASWAQAYASKARNPEIMRAWHILTAELYSSELYLAEKRDQDEKDKKRALALKADYNEALALDRPAITGHCPHCDSDQIVDLPTLLSNGQFSDTDRSIVHCDACDWLYCDGLPMTEQEREAYFDAEQAEQAREERLLC